MKKLPLCLFMLMLIIGCSSDHKLTIERLQLENKKCTACPKIDIDVPRALDETVIGKAINTSIREELISTLKFDEEKEVSTIEQAMTSFTNSYQEVQRQFTDEAIGWEAYIEGEVTFENERLITISLNSYNFTGGAHGYGSTVFLNFDKKKGVELEYYQLFKDLEGFIKLSEEKFRKQENIPAESLINSTGFMFSSDRFHLPENMGFSKEGLHLVYNQYEVASYADGPIEMTLPLEEVNPFLKSKFKVR